MRFWLKIFNLVIFKGTKKKLSLKFKQTLIHFDIFQIVTRLVF